MATGPFPPCLRGLRSGPSPPLACGRAGGAGDRPRRPGLYTSGPGNGSGGTGGCPGGAESPRGGGRQPGRGVKGLLKPPSGGAARPGSCAEAADRAAKFLLIDSLPFSSAPPAPPPRPFPSALSEIARSVQAFWTYTNSLQSPLIGLMRRNAMKGI